MTWEVDQEYYQEELKKDGGRLNVFTRHKRTVVIFRQIIIFFLRSKIVIGFDFFMKASINAKVLKVDISIKSVVTRCRRRERNYKRELSKSSRRAKTIKLRATRDFSYRWRGCALCVRLI